jgi:hypothetical protein
LVYVNEVQQKLHLNGIIDDRSFLLEEEKKKFVTITGEKNEKMNKIHCSHSMTYFNSNSSDILTLLVCL